MLNCRRRLKRILLSGCVLLLFIAFRVAQANSGPVSHDGSPPITTPANEAFHAIAQPPTDAMGENLADPTSPAYAEWMIWQLNQYRAQQQNLPPLKADPALMKAAQDYAARLALGNFFGHSDPDFGCNRPSDRAVAAGYVQWTVIGENLAAGYTTPEAALDALKRSPGHNAAILSPEFREIGIGYYYEAEDAPNVRQNGPCPYTGVGGPYRHYWVQLFGARTSNGIPVLPVIINGEAISTTQRQVDVYIHGTTGGSVWVQWMRFSEDNASWSAYEPYAPRKTLTLSGGSGLKTVYVQLMIGSTIQTASDTIYLQDTEAPSDPLLSPRVFIPIVRQE
jgi:uncharacterized protein YkwD